jgi:hypothetical protein
MDHGGGLVARAGAGDRQSLTRARAACSVALRPPARGGHYFHRRSPARPNLTAGAARVNALGWDLCTVIVHKLQWIAAAFTREGPDSRVNMVA